MSSMYDPGQELSSLDFGNLIGGPLSAVVDAQIRAAESTVSYIKDVGFNADGDPNYVAFTYPKEVSPYVAGEPHFIATKVKNGGSGYNVIPYVEIIGDGTGAKAEAVMQDDGSGNGTMEVKEIVITNQGYNYTRIDEIKVLPPTGDKQDDTITITKVGGSKEIQEVTIDRGNGSTPTKGVYSHSPILELPTTGDNGKLEAVLNEVGEIVEVVIIDKGTNYIANETITIKDLEGDGAIITVNFTSGKPSQAAQFMDMKLEVPLLTMVPIPYIRVEETTISFNAKINSVERISSEQSIGANLNFSSEKSNAKANSSYNSTSNSTSNKNRKFFKGTNDRTSTGNYSGNRSFSKESKKTKFNVSASYKRTDNRNTSIEKTYTMGIMVKATQEEIPAGMEKVLGILENTIISQPI